MDERIVISDDGAQVALFTLGAITLAMVLESLWPRRSLDAELTKRWVNNLSLSLVTWYCGALATNAFLLSLAWWTNVRSFGLLQHYAVGLVPSFVILLLVSQLISYLTHVAFHKISWLWPLHAIHHTDVDVDVTTSYRHHPFEFFITVPIAAPVVLLLGAPMEVAVANQLLLTAVTIFSHSNIYLPQSLDKILRWVIITPDFHRLHHCSERHYTDSNYGSLLPWYDYLFGTATQRDFSAQETMQLGLGYQRQPQDSRLDRMLLLPFRWRQQVNGRPVA